MDQTAPGPYLGDLKTFRCEQHAKRAAAAVCRLCGKVLCAECATKVGGLNHCSSCIPRVAVPEAAAVTSSSQAIRRFLVAGLFAFFVALGVAYGVGRPLIEGFTQVSRNEEIVEDVRQALRTFHMDTGRWPTLNEGLASLTEGPDNLTTWDGPYLYDAEFQDGEILDAYGGPLYYWSREGIEEAYLVSAGPDRELNSTGLGTPDPRQLDDDLLVWTDDGRLQ